MDPQYFALLRAFFSLTPTNLIKFPSESSLSSTNDFLVENILLNKHFQSFPPSRQYQKQFWKWAIETMESQARKCDDQEHGDDFEIDSRIYDHYLSIMTPSGPTTGSSHPNVRSQICGSGVPGREAPSQSFITHFWNPENPLQDPSLSNQDVEFNSYLSTTLLESRTTIESGTTGLRTWMASFILSQYLIVHPELIAKKRVLELGSGIGFLGTIVSTLQYLELQKDPSPSHSYLFLTDINDEVLARCRDNVSLPCNASSRYRNISYIQLDWFESMHCSQSTHLERVIKENINPDIILGADVVFDPSLIPPLVGTLKIALQLAGPDDAPKLALIALTVRNETTLNAFLSCVQDSGLVVNNLDVGFKHTPFSETIETHNSCEDVRLFCITRP